MNELSKARKQLVQWVKDSLTGEKLDKNNVLYETNPFIRYTTGILYPAGSELESIDEVDEQSDERDEGVAKKNKHKHQPPSSMGFSFFVNGSSNSIRIFFGASKFSMLKKEGNQRRWEKQNLTNDDGEEIEAPLDRSSRHYIFNDKGRIDVVVRPYSHGRIVTVTLSNMTMIPSHDQEDRKDLTDRDRTALSSLFETKLRCFLSLSSLSSYPRVNQSLLSEEEQELELRYKDERIYAIGHGVAVDWHINANEIEIFSDFMPIVEVPQVTADTGDDSDTVLKFNFLETIQTNFTVVDKLKEFVDNYSDWIGSQEDLAETESSEEQVTAQRIIARMNCAEKRMRSSISMLQDNEKAQYAFAIANRAMNMQMSGSASPETKTSFGWRPFQLAFFLTSLESSIDENSEYRDWVDLIWFPTGGGKTEAYLGVMAFVFAYRRLTYSSSGAGTTAIMRYTLRLLTSQQFVRACKVVSALELIRRNSPELGDELFSVGLWLGGDSSPNNFTQAVDYLKNQNYSKFVLRQCPWCQSEFTKKNYVASEHSFHFSCSNASCEFGRVENNKLPFNVVDEALYENPPSLLIATVDKFARLPWEARANSFFGGKKHRPPELVIQDELHLISGSLGSIVGLYEVGIEAILISRGVYPKFIASTATIRQAAEQVRALFGRDMAVFPPVGLRQQDSYFAKEVPLSEKPGRLYVGYLSFYKGRQKCLEDLAGALIAAPKVLFKDKPELMDAWWTQLVYHGSLKGVGNSRTNFQSGIPIVEQRLLLTSFLNDIDNIEPGQAKQFRENIANFSLSPNAKCPKQLLQNNDLKSLFYQHFPSRNLNIKTLTSNQTADENASVFDALATQHDHPNSIDAALATNMVSVGLDESRLALMIINGQPLTTAEYIQASSRVGRGKTPGIVFANYYKTQATSLSHYENFRSFHRSFYRFVEPFSLTPFTQQVRKRALHAALVSAVRHGEKGLLDNTDAGLFSSTDPVVSKIIKEMKLRIKYALTTADSLNSEAVTSAHAHLDRLVIEWETEAASSTNLRYKQYDKTTEGLLAPFENNQHSSGLWKTLNSMRSVEKTGLLEIGNEQSHDR